MTLKIANARIHFCRLHIGHVFRNAMNINREQLSDQMVNIRTFMYFQLFRIKMFGTSNIFSYLRTMSFFNLARACCRAEQASCLACSLGISVDEYCMDNPLMSGCEEGNIYKMINCWLISQYQVII